MTFSSTHFDALRPSPADVRVITSDGSSIPAHSSVLASSSPSPVLERMIGRARRRWNRDCAVPHPRRLPRRRGRLPPLPLLPEAAAMSAHAYRVAWLKRRAEEAVAARLTAERAVDALKLAKLCDAPRLSLRCRATPARTSPQSSGPRAGASRPATNAALQLLHDADQEGEMGEGEGVPGRVPAAQRRHGLSGAHLHRRIVVRRRRMDGSFVC